MSRAAVLSLCAAALTGCAATGLLGRDSGSLDWLDYAGSVQTLQQSELEVQYQQVLREHDAAPTPAAKIKLALLVSAPHSSRLDLALAARMLGDARSDPGATEQDVAFATFLQPLVARLQSQQAELTELSAARESLLGQLEALKALETQLNADESAN